MLAKLTLIFLLKNPSYHLLLTNRCAVIKRGGRVMEAYGTKPGQNI